MKQTNAQNYIRLNGQRPGTITPATIEAARAVPLSDFLGHANKVLCPLHNDTNPSLSIDHSKNIWYCHGCGRGGDVIDFIIERDHIDFKTAVKVLAGS